MKRYFIILLVVLILLFSSLGFSRELHVNTWIPYFANGATLKILSPNEVVFNIVRKNPGPKSDIFTHGYTYLLSNLIPVDKDWKKIVVKGTWWREKGPENYQEIIFTLFAKRPPFPHGRKIGCALVTNFIGVSYGSWPREGIGFHDMGKDLTEKTGKEMKRAIPKTPREFKLVLYRKGESWWEYWEKDKDGKWNKLYEQEVSFIFSGLKYPFTNFYIKIGGWTTWEHPIESKVHFKNLSITYEK